MIDNLDLEELCILDKIAECSSKFFNIHHCFQTLAIVPCKFLKSLYIESLHNNHCCIGLARACDILIQKITSVNGLRIEYHPFIENIIVS
jgi:hypothetical protein